MFCLDTIKTNGEFELLNEKYCKRRVRGLKSYVYLSSYSVYVPVMIESFCGTIFCYKQNNVLIMNVNKNLNWLINNEFKKDYNQEQLDETLKEYFVWMGKKDKSNSSLIIFSASSVKDNKKRDSLYINLVSGYYTFIKGQKKKHKESLRELMIKYPFNLQIKGGYQFWAVPPPPPLN